MNSIPSDSDRVESGCLIVALPGAGEGRHCQVRQAPLRGAVAVLGEWPPDDVSEDLPWGAFTFAQLVDVRKAWLWLWNNGAHLCKLGADPVHDYTDGSTAGLAASVLRSWTWMGPR